MRLRFLTAALLVSFGVGPFAGAALADEALIAEGEKVFRKCAACHMIGPDAVNRVGPELTDVIGRTAGSVEGFKYSKAMIEAGENGKVWNNETLHDYLENPRGVVKGTNMAFAGLKKLEERDAVIAYIEAQQGPAS